MSGTLYLLLGLLAFTGFLLAPNEGPWLVWMAIVFLAPAVVLLYRTGRQI